MSWRSGLAAAVLSILISAAGADAAGPLGFAGVSLGASEAEVQRLFPNADCRVATGVKSAYRCFVNTFAWGIPTGAGFFFSDHDRSVASIVLNFAPQYYGQVLPRLVLEFGQATQQRGATLFWKVGDGGIVLDARAKGENFRIFMTTDATIDRSAK